MKKKILYLFSDTGGGHRSAAKSLIAAVNELKGADAPEQEMVDVFARCSAFLNMFAKMYAPVIRYAPWLWGALYHLFNDPKNMGLMEKSAMPFVKKGLAALIMQTKPDVIVSVHPLLNHITVTAMKLAGHVVPLITVVTDPVSFHRSWVCTDANKIIVATDEAKKSCLEYGADPEKLSVIGLPIDPKFSKPSKGKTATRTELQLNAVLFTVLIMGGGEGGGDISGIVSALDAAGLPIQVIVICGRNEKLRLALEKKSATLSFPAKIFGFTDQVQTIMSASDMVITKAGPGSIAEALAKELPMIITSWLPGQEEGNVDFVRAKELGIIEKDFKKIPAAVRSIMDPENYKKYLESIKRSGNPMAVFTIAEIILNEAGIK